VVEPRERRRLAGEAMRERRFGDDLERDDLARVLVPRAVHGAGRTAADLRLDPVASAVEDRRDRRVRQALGVGRRRRAVPEGLEATRKLRDELAARIARLEMPLDLGARRRRERTVDECERRVLVETLGADARRRHAANLTGAARQCDIVSRRSGHDEPR